MLVLDKPPRMSSAQAVDHVKKRLRIKRAGHGGTLDPIATGVLAICIGEATKLAAYLLADDKEYEAEALLGVETDTLDRTGDVTATHACDAITRGQIETVLAAHRGELLQVPPMFSAIKQGGVRLYHRARAGEHVERAPRTVRIDRLELLAFQPATQGVGPRIRVAIACSKGTYVRTLLADIGTALGCGAHMTELRRTRSGRFTLAMAHDLDRLDNFHLVPLEEATELPVVIAPAELVPRIRSGLQLPPDMFAVPIEYYEKFQLFDPDRRLVAIAHVEGNRVVYDRVFGVDASRTFPQSAP
ncbi:MAG TPA: tRNA pseudouridine(55) synthase TruB [Kofleriaceae bacterium]